MRRGALMPWVLAAGGVLAACSSNGANIGFGNTGSNSSSSKGGDGGPTTTPTGGGEGGISLTGGGGDAAAQRGDTGASTACTYDKNDTADHDGDGWSSADGDCNDCNKYINPGAYDVPGNGIDEDCSGKADDEPTGCDSALSGPATSTASDGAKAMDICRTAVESAPLPQKTWGLISAAYVLPDGTTTTKSASLCLGAANAANFGLGFGLLGPTFGTSNKTQQGEHMLGLSSGTARQPTDTGYKAVSGFDKCYTSGAPSGFPGETPACGNVAFGKPHDGAALQVVIRVPTNALTMSFDSNFFSYEFPEWVCSEYNDTFVVIMTPAPAGEPSTANDNIAFDAKGNIVSVNAGFLQVCNPTNTAGASGSGPKAGAYSYACPEGSGKLAGTGFQGHASTDWLTTQVSVADLAGKEITLLFAVWDSSDGNLDTTVLLDNLTWSFATSPNTAPPPVTPPTTQPK
jgi:hypothetical protein